MLARLLLPCTHACCKRAASFDAGVDVRCKPLRGAGRVVGDAIEARGERTGATVGIPSALTLLVVIAPPHVLLLVRLIMSSNEIFPLLHAAYMDGPNI